MREPRRTWKLIASAACLSLTAAGAAPEAPVAPAGSADPKQQTVAADEFKQIQDEYRQAQEAFSEAYKAAKDKDDAERTKIVEEKYPKPDRYTPRYLAFAEKNPDAPQATEALLFVLGMSRAGDDFKRALDLVVTRYAASASVGQIVERIAFNSDASVEAALQTILEKNPDRQIKGKATYSLGQHYLYAGKPAGAEKRFEEVV